MAQRNELDFDKLQNELQPKLRELRKEFSTYYADYLLLEEYSKPIEKIGGYITSVNGGLITISQKIPEEHVLRIITQDSNIGTLKSLSNKRVPNLISEITTFLENPLKNTSASAEDYKKLEKLCQESLELLEGIKKPLETQIETSTVDDYKFDPSALPKSNK